METAGLLNTFMKNDTKLELDTDLLLTPKEVCGILKISRSSLHNLTHAGEIKAIRVGYLLRYHRNEIKRILYGEAVTHEV